MGFWLASLEYLWLYLGVYLKHIMKNKFLAIQILSALAFMNATYLSYKAYFVRFVDPNNLTSFCDVSKLFTCSDVLRHPLSQIYGVSFPWIAMLVYPIIFSISFFGYKKMSPRYGKMLAAVSFLGVMFNGFIMYRETMFIHSYCLLCFICTLIIVSIFVLAISITRK